MSKLILIDGNSLLYKAYYATSWTGNLMYSKKAESYTNAIHGFASMLIRFISNENPEYIAVAFDKGSKTFRHKMYPEYKGTRSETDQELIQQIPISREFLDAAGIAHFEMDEYEADDIIGTLAKQNKGLVDEIIILTSDHDMLQLIDSNITVALSRKGITEIDLVTEDNIEDLKGVSADKIVDMKALMGDSSDNIPGVRGIGPKTASKLINKHGSLDELLKVAPSKSQKMYENIVLSSKEAKMSYKLSKIVCDIKNDIAIEDLTFFSLHNDLEDFLNKYELNSIKKLI